MTSDQDVADYLDLFLANMKSREIPEAARAKHLLPLLNAKGIAATAGLTAEAKNSIDMLVKTLMDTAHVAPAYVSQTFWNYDKEASEGVRAATVKLTWHAKRLGNNADEILDRILAEKVMQMYHLEVQQCVREKEPKDALEASDLVVRFFKLKGIEELKYVKAKPWTYKPTEERSKEKSESSHQSHDPNRSQDKGGASERNFSNKGYETSKGAVPSNPLVTSRVTRLLKVATTRRLGDVITVVKLEGLSQKEACSCSSRT